MGLKCLKLICVLVPPGLHFAGEPRFVHRNQLVDGQAATFESQIIQDCPLLPHVFGLFWLSYKAEVSGRDLELGAAVVFEAAAEGTCMALRF